MLTSSPSFTAIPSGSQKTPLQKNPAFSHKQKNKEEVTPITRKSGYLRIDSISTIVALEPCLGQDGGNAVRVYTRDGRAYLDERTIKSVLKNICACYNADLSSLRSNYGQYLHCKLDVPIPLSPVLVLVSIKMRRPLFENDGATGYVNLLDVTAISPPDPDRDREISCLVDLKGGHSLPSLFSEKNVRQRLGMANVALDRFKALQGRARESEQVQKLLDQDPFEDEGSQLFKEIIKALVFVRR